MPAPTRHIQAVNERATTGIRKHVHGVIIKGISPKGSSRLRVYVSCSPKIYLQCRRVEVNLKHLNLRLSHQDQSLTLIVLSVSTPVWQGPVRVRVVLSRSILLVLAVMDLQYLMMGLSGERQREKIHCWIYSAAVGTSRPMSHPFMMRSQSTFQVVTIHDYMLALQSVPSRRSS